MARAPAPPPQVVLFTAGAASYAAPLARLLDPHGTVFAARLYRDDACVDARLASHVPVKVRRSTSRGTGAPPPLRARLRAVTFSEWGPAPFGGGEGRHSGTPCQRRLASRVHAGLPARAPPGGGPIRGD
jgi:hypothetical protein